MENIVFTLNLTFYTAYRRISLNPKSLHSILISLRLCSFGVMFFRIMNVHTKKNGCWKPNHRPPIRQTNISNWLSIFIPPLKNSLVNAWTESISQLYLWLSNYPARNCLATQWDFRLNNAICLRKVFYKIKTVLEVIWRMQRKIDSKWIYTDYKKEKNLTIRNVLGKDTL